MSRRSIYTLTTLLGCWLAPYAEAHACWRVLQFGASNGLLDATTTLRYSTRSAVETRNELHAPDQGQALFPHGNESGYIHVDFTALKSNGEMHVWYDEDSRQVLQSQRIGHGRESRMKLHRFLSDGVWRERFESDPGLQRWVPGKHERIPYPAAKSANKPVLVPLQLLDRAAQLARGDTQKSASYLVFTDRQLYEVTLQPKGISKMAIDFDLDDGVGQKRIRETASVLEVAIQPRLLDNPPEDEPFTLFELGGTLTLFIDRARGLPVRVQGGRFGFDSIPANLNAAETSATCADHTH